MQEYVSLASYKVTPPGAVGQAVFGGCPNCHDIYYGFRSGLPGYELTECGVCHYFEYRVR